MLWLATATVAKNLWKEDNMTRFIALLLIASPVPLSSRAATPLAGAGEDISKGGQAIHNTAEQAK